MLRWLAICFTGLREFSPNPDKRGSPLKTRMHDGTHLASPAFISPALEREANEGSAHCLVGMT
jgi:hypothetical protein